MFSVEIAGEKEVAKHYENRFKEEKFKALLERANESGYARESNHPALDSHAAVLMRWLHKEYRLEPYEQDVGMLKPIQPKHLYPTIDHIAILADFGQMFKDLGDDLYKRFNARVKTPFFSRYTFKVKMTAHSLEPYRLELRLDEIKLDLMKKHPLEVFNQIDFRIKVIEEPTSDRMRLETRNHRNLKELA